MPAETTEVFSSNASFENYYASVASRLTSRREERLELLRRGTARLESLRRVAQEVRRPDLERDLAEKLDAAAKKLRAFEAIALEIREIPSVEEIREPVVEPETPARVGATTLALEAGAERSDTAADEEDGGEWAACADDDEFPTPPDPVFASVTTGATPHRRGRPLRLQVTVGRQSFGRRLNRDSMVIGRRDPDTRLCPDIDLWRDHAVSRRHAEITRKDGSYFLTDLGSTNGTKVNGELLKPHEERQLQPGDEITLGERTQMKVAAE
jgi:hypothetical protein